MKYLGNARGFTLAELLVAISIITVLIGIGIGVYNSSFNSIKKSREVSACRTLLAGFHAYSADNGGRVIKSMDPNPGRVVDDRGRPVMAHAARRWPWRLAPYINYDINALMVNNLEAAPRDNVMYSYLVTVFTTLGMNGLFVGGKYGTSYAPDHPRNNRGNFCVVNIIQPHSPSNLIVFASAKMQNAPNTGCFDVGVPGYGSVGLVDYKYGDKAVVGYFDGHVKMNNMEELKDMRKWSNLAAQQDNPNWSF